MRIEEDLMDEIRSRAAEQHVSINSLINRLLRDGLRSVGAREKPFREKVYDMGEPVIDLTKANSIAAEMYDRDHLRKMGLLNEGD